MAANGMIMNESAVQKNILAYLRHKRVYHFRFQAQSNLNGLPDIICLYKGFFLGLELKREKGGAPTLLQLKKIKAINDNGGIGVIVRSVDEVDDIFILIDIYGKSISNQELLDKYEEIRMNKNEKK